VGRTVNYNALMCVIERGGKKIIDTCRLMKKGLGCRHNPVRKRTQRSSGQYDDGGREKKEVGGKEMRSNSGGKGRGKLGLPEG